jgi:hypothetical protein
MDLPLRYIKASYSWCLAFMQMTKRCSISIGVRDWTKKEMKAYIDWNTAEEQRIDSLVAQEQDFI